MRRKSAKIKVTQYDKLVTAFRDEPGNISNAAREASVQWTTARRGWERGWPDLKLLPICEVIKQEQIAARAQAESERRHTQRGIAERELIRQHENKEKARGDAVAARKAEADLVRANRGNTIALVSVTGRALRGALHRAHELEERVKSGTNSDGTRLRLLDEVNLLDRLARTVERASKAARETMAMERILLGEPTEIIGVRDVDSMTEDEAIREMELAAEAAQRARERKVRREQRLRLIQGGAAEAIDSDE